MATSEIPGCEAGRPTAETLEAGFGFRPPPAFVHFVQTVWDVAEARGLPSRSLFRSILTRPEGVSARYGEMTPPELFVFASTGSDGEHYGYLVHAPELPATDHLVGSSIPGPGYGVCYLGRSTGEAIENAVAYWHQSDPVAEPVLEVLTRLGLTFDPARADRVRWLQGGDYVRLVPEVPRGWTYAPTSDGVGVLAPADAFGPEISLPSGRRTADDWLAAARQADRPASRLIVLKEGYGRADGGDFQALLDELCATYLALGRPQHAEMAGR